MQLQAKFKALHVDPLNHLIHTATYSVSSADGLISGELVLVGKGEDLDTTTDEQASILLTKNDVATEQQVPDYLKQGFILAPNDDYESPVKDAADTPEPTVVTKSYKVPFKVAVNDEVVSVAVVSVEAP